MWPPQPTLWLKNLTLLLILTSTPHIFAQPTDRRPALPPNERGLSNLLGGSALGNLTDDIGDLIQDATSLLTTFIGAVQAFNNATNENDLLELLGVGLKGNTEDDEDSVTNSTISAAGPNSTCPGMAVLFARGTAEPGKHSAHAHSSIRRSLTPSRQRRPLHGPVTLHRPPQLHQRDHHPRYPRHSLRSLDPGLPRRRVALRRRRHGAPSQRDRHGLS